MVTTNNDRSANGRTSMEDSPDRSSHNLQKGDRDFPRPKISFEGTTESKRLSSHESNTYTMHNNRKQSYASVREESDVPQSFRTRKASNGSDAAADQQAQQPGYVAKSTKRLSLSYEYEGILANESAVVDDSDESPQALSRTESHDSEGEVKAKNTTIEDLPDEILDLIFTLVQIDAPPDIYQMPRSHLFSCLLVSKSVHAAALRVLYKHISIYRSKTFHKLVTSLERDAELGKLIQTLDFSHYSQMGYGKSRGQTNITPYLTKDTLTATLSRTPLLKAFLVHEHLDDELDLSVLSTLFSIPSLQAVDLTSCMSEPFVTSFTAAWTNTLSHRSVPIRRLCLHECTTLKPEVFETILPQLTQLTHLDIAHTRVNDKALMALPHTARITHLNLERCTQITGDAVVRFLTQHPAARDTMVWLNLNADASRYRLLSEDELDTLLPALPPTLKALNIGGARITARHVPALRLLATRLEELGLKGANLSLSADITDILSLPRDKNSPLENPEMKSSLRYIDLTDIKSVTQMSLSYSPVSIKDNGSLPLEVIELGANVLTEIARRNKNVKDPDWTVKELGRRGWYVRSPAHLPTNVKLDDGYRRWKMGARWWGMRKIPMIEQEVGGMYGYFMFKRN